MKGTIASIDEGQRRLAAIAVCCLVATLGWPLTTVVSILIAMFFVARSQSQGRAKLETALRRLELFAATEREGDAETRLEHVANVLEETALRDPERVMQQHRATGVPTREPLIARMSSDAKGVLGVVCFADYDRLNAFDPSLGHQLLVEATTRLKAMLPPTRLLAHVDRAHLAVWFGPNVDSASAQAEMDAVVYALGATLVVNGRHIQPEVKVQMAQLAGGDPAVVLTRTLARLNVSSEEVTDVRSVSGGETLAKERFALEQDLRLALSAGELQLRYQPLVDAAAGAVCGAEALIRWRHPQRGMIAPSRFIPLLESAGLAHEIGLWVINTACREAWAWKAAELPDLRIAVNVSAYQIERDDLPTLIARTLERHALRPDSLEIELTESAALVDCERARTLFSRLRELGVRIAIDDFGTGYSSLSTLRSLTFDKIKIDREFVTDVETRKDSQAICQSVIALARGLGIGVLAEGVERAEEYIWLRQHGCSVFQGYFFSSPLEGSDFIDFVRNREQLVDKLALHPRALQQNIIERLSA